MQGTGLPRPILFRPKPCVRSSDRSPAFTQQASLLNPCPAVRPQRGLKGSEIPLGMKSDSTPMLRSRRSAQSRRHGNMAQIVKSSPRSNA